MNAKEIMQSLNPHALHATENGREVFVEDVKDPDGRWYRIEYQCNPDGQNASAWVRYNPWGSNRFSYNQSHLSSTGLICIGSGVSATSSPYDLEYAVARARFWCTGYSFLQEHGYRKTCELIPEWGSA